MRERRYKKLALACHPDKNPGDEQAKERFQRVGPRCGGWEVLRVLLCILGWVVEFRQAWEGERGKAELPAISPLRPLTARMELEVSSEPR